jgi:predicted GNAT family acetyltransferase
MKVRHDIEHSRFIIPLKDGEAELVYAKVGDDAIDLQHTEVPLAERNRGIADALVRSAIAYAREGGLQIIPTCPYVKAWFRRHPKERLTSGNDPSG